MKYYAHYINDDSQYLAHYGVLGMRWGVRHNKGYKADVKAINNSANFKGPKNRAAKKEAINEAKVKAANRLYSHNSESVNRKIQTRSTAKTLGMTALYGSYGTLHYDRARRGSGYGKGRSAVNGLLAKTINTSTGSLAGIHNYLKDRNARQTNQISTYGNRGYL